MAQCDKQFNEQVNGVISGAIREININMFEVSNPLAPTVSCPIRPDETKYISSLSPREKKIFDLYAELEANKDEKRLINLVETGELRPTDTNKEG